MMFANYNLEDSEVQHDELNGGLYNVNKLIMKYI